MFPNSMVMRYRTTAEENLELRNANQQTEQYLLTSSMLQLGKGFNRISQSLELNCNIEVDTRPLIVNLRDPTRGERLT